MLYNRVTNITDVLENISEGDDTEFGDLAPKTLLRPDEVALFL
jgi:hypothetical protein